MSSSATVLIDDSWLSRLDRGLLRLELFLTLVSGATILALVFMAVVSVVGRNLFNAPLPGYVDWVEQGMPLIAFMGISYLQRQGGHVRMDLAIARLSTRALYALEIATNILVLLLILALIYGSFSHFQRSFDFNAPLWSSDSSMDIAIPLWPAKLLVPIAFFVLLLRICLQLVAYSRALLFPHKLAVAIPMLEDAATQAANEAGSLSDDLTQSQQPNQQ